MRYSYYNEGVHPDWPVRWPAEWRDPSALDLVKGTPLGCLLFPSTEGFHDIVERARQAGLAICGDKTLPAGVEMVKGEWPGIRMASGGGDASSGPTGAPWVDSNGWLVRLTRSQQPGRQVWVTADPPKTNEVVRLPRHLVAVADSAAHGGRWVVSPDKHLAEGLAAGQSDALRGWKKLMDVIAFFEQHAEWNDWPVDAALGVVSSFSGDNEFFSHEVLNLAARTDVSYSILPKDGLGPEALRGLRGVLYPDSDPPSAGLRQVLLDFVENGGLLIAGPKWGLAPGAPLGEEQHPRYAVLRFGKGRIAMARQDPDDPYQVAQDAQILLSHRYDVVRFFNGFGIGSYCTRALDGNRALVHAVNYAGWPGDPPTARIGRRFRSAKLWSFDAPDARRLEVVAQNDAVEVPLLSLPIYGAIELEA